MPSPYTSTEQRPDPWSILDQAVHTLGGVVAHLILGAILGALLARAMRGCHLHWSWGYLGFAVVFATRDLFGGWALTLELAVLIAAHRGRRWHREDLDAGMDLAVIATERQTPLELLGRAVSSLRDRRRERRISGPTHDAGQFALARDDRGRTVVVPLGEHGGGRHTLVVGATGSGKTITQTTIAVAAIERGMGAVVLDPKGDSAMRAELEHAARSAGRRFLHWSPAGPCVYNPYGHGSETEIADKALAAERFTEPHYLRQAQRYLGHVVRALRGVGTEVSVRTVVDRLDPDRFELLVRELPESQAAETHAYLDSLSTRQRSDLAGVRDRLATLAESDVGPWLDPETPGAERFELLAAVRSRAIVYFDLESDRRPLLAQMLGAAIVQDLQTTVAALQEQPVATLVVVDEFSAVAAEQVVGLFGRARSAGLSLLLGTQELSDLRLPGRERLLEQVMGNLSVIVAHRQVVPTSAELISGVAGGRGAWRVSRHSDGRTTRTRVREAVLDPDRIMSLGQGWAAVIVLGGATRVRIAHVFPPQVRR
jgi:type IV secretory pathway TraG/TraD family ATPase VirD4